MLNFKSIAQLLAASTFLRSESLFCLAGLCEDNPDICELHTGCYSDHDCTGSCVCNKSWWAFKPVGVHACPPEGCPLYVWIDGTAQAPYQTSPDQFYMLEMVKRGFVAVNVEYDASTIDYATACDGNLLLLDFKGFNDKAQEIFDGTVADSVVNQMCAGPNALANCDLGVASHGWSQGAHIAILGSNYNTRVSASLLFGNGNYNSLSLSNLSCLDTENISLPPERRRSIAGSSDDYFGGSFSGVLRQQRETTGYDCGTGNGNCLARLPEGCLYGTDEEYCDEYSRYFSNVCTACNETPADGPCPSNSALATNACPMLVPDTYLGGNAMIEDTGGYYIITGEEYCSYLGCDPAAGAPHGFFQNLAPGSDFLKPETLWGLKQNLDWLALTARNTAASQPTTSPTTSPTKAPTKPTTSPTGAPTLSPTHTPTKSPMIPTTSPTGAPTLAPSRSPTKSPAKPTTSPTNSPSGKPTTSPSISPTQKPTSSPTKPPLPNPCSNCSSIPKNDCVGCGGGGFCSWSGKNKVCQSSTPSPPTDSPPTGSPPTSCEPCGTYDERNTCRGCGGGCSWNGKRKECVDA